MKKLYILFLLVMSIIILPFTQVDAQEETTEGQRSYLQQVHLEAKPGETVSKEVMVPVQVTQKDGTSHTEYETITFSISNEIDRKLIGDAGTNSELLSSWTYVTCSGWIQNSWKGFLSAIKFRYNGSVAEYNGTSPESHWESGGWVWGYRYTGSPQGSGTSQFTIKDDGTFSAGTAVDRHGFNWTFNGNGSCSATGGIYADYR